MTRLNIVAAGDLTDRHLVAEYKEITQFLHLVKKRISGGHPFDDIPKKYTLNGGHCRFFYDKGKYVHDRFIELHDEMLQRGMNVNEEKFMLRIQRIVESYNESLFGEYAPTKEDYKVAIDRIAERIDQKPHLYPDSDRFFESIPSYK